MGVSMHGVALNWIWDRSGPIYAWCGIELDMDATCMVYSVRGSLLEFYYD